MCMCQKWMRINQFRIVLNWTGHCFGGSELDRHKTSVRARTDTVATLLPLVLMTIIILFHPTLDPALLNPISLFWHAAPVKAGFLRTMFMWKGVGNGINGRNTSMEHTRERLLSSKRTRVHPHYNIYSLSQAQPRTDKHPLTDHTSPWINSLQ